MFTLFTNRKITMKEVVNTLDHLRVNHINFKNQDGFDHVDGNAIAYKDIFIERSSNGLITLYEENHGLCLPLYTNENLEEKIVAHPDFIKQLRKMLTKLNKLLKVS